MSNEHIRHIIVYEFRKGNNAKYSGCVWDRFFKIKFAEDNLNI